MLTERIRGDTLQVIGDRHGGLSPQGVRVVVAREGRRQVDDLERRLRANAETDELEAFLVPGHGGPDFQMALAYLQWSLAQLSERGIPTRVRYRSTTSGVVFGLELAEEA